jgi:hypothetical protein
LPAASLDGPDEAHHRVPEPSGDGYRLRKQHHSIACSTAPTKGTTTTTNAEAESLRVCDGALWICGSHCRSALADQEEGQTSYPLSTSSTRAGRHLSKVMLTDERHACEAGIPSSVQKKREA